MPSPLSFETRESILAILSSFQKYCATLPSVSSASSWKPIAELNTIDISPSPAASNILPPCLVLRLDGFGLIGLCYGLDTEGFAQCDISITQSPAGLPTIPPALSILALWISEQIFPGIHLLIPYNRPVYSLSLTAVTAYILQASVSELIDISRSHNVGPIELHHICSNPSKQQSSALTRLMSSTSC